MRATVATPAKERARTSGTSAPSAASAATPKAKAKAKAKPAPTLTYEKALEMVHALIAAYAKPSFQRKLHEAWDAAAGDLVAQGKARQAVCLAVQGPILKKFGFEATRSGVHQSVMAFDHASKTRGYDDPEGDYRGWLVGWLVNPEAQRSSEERNAHFARARGQKVVERREPRPPVKRELDTPMTKLVHLSPDRPLLYGARMPGERAPSAFLALPKGGAGELGPLVDYLREDPHGPFSGMVDPWPESRGTIPGGRWGAWGFDVGANGKEQLLKADWHSVQKWGPKKLVFVPRFGELISMRQAPPRLLAFLEAFREVNMDVWNTILAELERLKERVFDSAQDANLIWLVDTIGQVFRDRGFLGAIEAQVWWGGTRTPTRSHKDGITSLLHLSITLNGRRTLRVGSFDSAWAQGPMPMMYNTAEFRDWQERQHCDGTGEPAPSQLWRENNVWDDEAWKPRDLTKVSMNKGDIYMSSPFVFEHGVMYEQCDRTSPIIALQCRLAFRDAEAALKVNELRDMDMLRVATAVAECLQRAGDEGRLRIPSLAEVRSWEARIAKLPEALAAACAAGRSLGETFTQVVPRQVFSREAPAREEPPTGPEALAAPQAVATAAREEPPAGPETLPAPQAAAEEPREKAPEWPVDSEERVQAVAEEPAEEAPERPADSEERPQAVAEEPAEKAPERPASSEERPQAAAEEPAEKAPEWPADSEERLQALERAHPGKEALLRALVQLVQDGSVQSSELVSTARLFAEHCSNAGAGSCAVGAC